MSKLILNTEADEILYRSAFATEKQGYRLITRKGEVRDFGNRYTKTQIIKKVNSLQIKDYTLEGYKIVEPLENSLYLVKRNIKKLSLIGEPKLWLSPSDGSNFRFGIAKTSGPRGLGYKAGRAPRPVHYSKIREYLIKYHGAQEIQGYEADDALGMYQVNNSVAVHIDKDINMIAGKHLNWVTGERYIVETDTIGDLPCKEHRGTYKAFFFHQLLTGDNTDNIPGIANIGPVKATKLLAPAKTEKEMLDIVLKVYDNVYKEESYTKVIEMANLLYIVDSNNRKGENYIKELL